MIDKVVTNWGPQQYRKMAPADLPKQILDNALATATAIRNDDGTQTPVFTLGHLAAQTGVDVWKLRKLVGRKNKEAYRTFLLKKNSGGPNSRAFRVISVPTTELAIVQKWICNRILSHQHPHSASKAYSPGNSLVKAVESHLRCTWLIKLDITAFFDTISEIAAYRVFRAIGYQPIVAFELSRLCTRVSDGSKWRNQSRWTTFRMNRYKISDYRYSRVGFLPQGASTSPMLANLAMKEFDKAMTVLAVERGFKYTRYADDLAFSTDSENCKRETCKLLIRDAYSAIVGFGFTPNLTKTKISPPGGRKLLLGLLVDGDIPRLTKDFRKQMRTHLHYLETYGVVAHVKERGFDSIFGARNHLMGLAYYARQIDHNYGDGLLQRLTALDWPV